MRPVPDFLAHLRRDRRGLPVPFINRWGPENTARCAVAYDSNVGRLGVFDHDHDEPDPDFTAQNMGRQRQCIFEGLCQVCGRFVPWSRRFLVLSTISLEVITTSTGRLVPAVSEPWLDERCAVFAVETCPALIRRRHTDRLVLVAVESKRLVELSYTVGAVDNVPGAEPPPSGLTVAPDPAAQARLPALWGRVLLSNVAVPPLLFSGLVGRVSPSTLATGPRVAPSTVSDVARWLTDPPGAPR